MLPVPPDPEQLVIASLKAQSAIAAICGDRIDTVMPNPAQFPLIRVTLVGDFGPDGEGSNDVVLQLECWADDDATASLLARTVVACRLDLRASTAAGWIALTDVSSVIPAPDPDSSRSRFNVDMPLRVGS